MAHESDTAEIYVFRDPDEGLVVVTKEVFVLPATVTLNGAPIGTCTGWTMLTDELVEANDQQSD